MTFLNYQVHETVWKVMGPVESDRPDAPKSEPLPVILFWTKMWKSQRFDGEAITKHQNKYCPYQCRYTMDRSTLATARAVVMEPRIAEDLPTRANKDQLMVFYSQEPPSTSNRTKMLRRWPKNLVNLTVTYLPKSDVPIPYGRIVKLGQGAPKDLIPCTAASERCNYENPFFAKYDWDFVKRLAARKTKGLFSLISNCHSPGKREEYIESLQKYLPVDTFGSCGRENCTVECMQDNLRDYKFYLAFENSVCEEYVTEKFFRFKNLIVPIVLRQKDYLNLLPRGSYIAVDQFSSFKQLVAHIGHLMRNTTDYLKYFEWTKSYRPVDYDIHATALCGICKATSDGNYRKSYYDISKWFSHDQCEDDFARKLLQKQIKA
ncbi:fucosyl transferase [Aphelenchoides avenae]|nr:fucosyl transferase [Aphelenchus avenae]